MPITGLHHLWPAFPSRHLGRPRDVIIWLPPGYHDTLAAQRLPVLYLHDGRQVFDPDTSTWGHDWQVDDLAQTMIPDHRCAPFIAVAADCTPDRESEYDPLRRGADYLRFLAEELKPAIDNAFRTDPARSAVAGASMGGLIAFYEAWSRPDLFQAAACLSPAFAPPWGPHLAGLIDTAARARSLPPVRWFLSCGGAGDLEATLLRGTLDIADRLRAAGYPPPALRLLTDPAAEHNELAWSRLVPSFLPFLFPAPSYSERS